MRALVLARGRGLRMRADDSSARLTLGQRHAASAGWKVLMPIGGRPFLDYVLSALADAGCREAGVVIGPEQRDAFLPYVHPSPATERRVRVTLVEQREPCGTADAVRSAAGWVGAEPFLVVNGDNLYPAAAVRSLMALEGPGTALFDRESLVHESNIPMDRVAEFALAELDATGNLARITEKPPAPTFGSIGGRALVSMNAWRFNRDVLRACEDVGPSARGEYELPAAVELAIARGVTMKAIVARGSVLDLSRQVDVEAVARRLALVDPRP